MSAQPDAPGQIRIGPDLAAFAEYQPTPTPAALAARLGLPAAQIVKLDANEKSLSARRRGWPPRWPALDASRYPDADAGALREALAAYTGRPAWTRSSAATGRMSYSNCSAGSSWRPATPW